MINRIATLQEDITYRVVSPGDPENGIPATLEPIAWVPKLAQFGSDCAFIVPEAGGFFTVYKTREQNKHYPALVLWRHGDGLYAIFGNGERIKDIGEKKNAVAYCAKATNEWRVYSCDGTDSAVDPETKKAIGAFTGRIVRFKDQPPKTINKSKPYVFETLTITKVEPCIDGTVAGFDFPTNTGKAVDPVDEASEPFGIKSKQATLKGLT
jgi:hypothetical protein